MERKTGLELLYPYGGLWVGLWKALRKWGHLVNNKMSFVKGDGQRIKFWRDRWCGDLRKWGHLVSNKMSFVVGVFG